MDTHYSTEIIALEPNLAPNHVARFRNLIKEGFYDGRYFYRVVVEENDMFAAATGCYHGFAVGIDNTNQQMW